MFKKSTTDNFIKKSISIHGNKYDYSLVQYDGNRNKVKIICKQHGVFEQKPINHLNGCGCVFCCKTKKLTTPDFIRRSMKIHKNLYDYSLVNYINNETKVDIICKKHGIFSQTPHHHLKNIKCPMCSHNKKLSTEEFIEKSIFVHGNKYSYIQTKYINGKTKIIIICKQHGIFKQKPTDHLNGCGCPLCKESQGEKQIRVFLEKNNIEFIPQYKFPNCKYKQKLSFDFYIPNRNLCIEFDGEQHFNRFRFENDDVGLNIRKIRDNIKSEYCKNNNIRLIRINCRDNISEILNSQF